MAAIALAALASGFLTGAAKNVAREREENEALIQSRLKMAAINKKKREAEMEARKSTLMDRYNSLTPFFDGSEEMEEKLALLSNDAITKDFVDRRSRGEMVDLKQYLVMSKDKIPKNFTTVQQYIDTLSAAPQPVTSEQMQAALGDTRGFLGARTGVSAGRAEKIAGALGAGSAAELLAYERMEPVSAEPLMEVAKINVELFPRAPKTLDEQITQQQSVVSATIDKHGEDSEEAKEAITRLDVLNARKNLLAPEAQKIATERDRLKFIVLTDSSPKKRQEAEEQLRRLANLDRSPDSAMTINNLFQDAAARAVEREHGRLVGKDIVITPKEDGLGNTVNTYRYIGTDAATKARIENTALMAIRNVADNYMDTKGIPLNDNVRTALATYGILFKDGKFQWDVAMPPAVTMQAPARVVPDGRVTPPTTPLVTPRTSATPAPATPAPATPAPQTMTPQDRQAAEWLKQNPNHPRAAEIRQTLERKYGK